MAFIHGKNTAVLLAEYDLSAYFNSVDAEQSLETHETTTFGKSAKTYKPGLLDGSASTSGLFDGATGAVEDALVAAMAASGGKPLSILLPGSGTQGNRGRLAQVLETSHKVSSPVGDLVSTSADWQPSGGLWGCYLLAPLAAQTATGNGTGHDDGASSANGFIANLHCTAASGTTPTADVTIEHSADDTTYATLGTFTQLTAAGSEQITGTGTVNRYVREARTIGGTTPSFTYAITLARK